MVFINKNLSYKRDNHESLFTILLHNFTKEEFISDLKDKLNQIKSIKNSFKRIKLNDRIFNLMQQVENNKIHIFNHIILVSDDIIYINLESDDIKLLKEYDIPKYTFEYGEYFNIEWLTDLFNNFNFYNIVINNNNKFTYYKGNSYKKKIVAKDTNIEYVKIISEPFFYIGKPNTLIKNKNMLETIPIFNSWFDIIENINKYEMKKRIIIFQELLDKMSTDPDKFIFGSDIYEFIEQYNVKELYIHADSKKQFDDNIINKELTDNMNFSIIIISSDPKTYDASNILLKNYNGILGIKYY
jgi:hypothetical protein